MNLKSDNQNPTLSLCMIVKNEEIFLPQCLDSVKDYVDELIIVDTGSTDKTVEIAERYNAKVFHHPWENSFSKARNYSIKYATCDWILILDADEEIEKEDARKLREVIKDNDVNVINLPVLYGRKGSKHTSITNSERMFRNHLGIRYEGIVHNSLKHPGPNTNANIRLYHYGYHQGEEQMEKKYKRTATLLREQIKEDPGNPVPHLYLATSCLDRQRLDESIHEALEAIRLFEKQDSNTHQSIQSYYVASVAFYRKHDLVDAETYALKAVGFHPGYVDAHCILSSIYFLRREYDKCAEATGNYLKSLESVKSDLSTAMTTPYDTLQHAWLAHSRMAINHFEKDNEKEGLQSLKNAVNCADNAWEPFLAIGKHFMEHNNSKLAERFLRDGLKHNPKNKEMQYYLADAYEKSGTSDKALVLFTKILQNHAGEILAQYRLGLLLAKNNQHEKAISSFKSVIRMDKKHTDALFSLAVSCEIVGDITQAKDTYNNILKIKPEYPEVLVRLGALYLNELDYIKAEECFLNTIKLDKYLIEAHLALSRIYIFLNVPESCVMSCDELLKCLDLPRNVTIDSVSDLSKLYVSIGETLKAQQKKLLANVSFEIAALLNADCGMRNKIRNLTMIHY